MKNQFLKVLTNYNVELHIITQRKRKQEFCGLCNFFCKLTLK